MNTLKEEVDKESETLLIRSARWDGVDENTYLEKTRKNAQDISADITINGSPGIKQEVYWNNEFFSGHMCSQYWWVENGMLSFYAFPRGFSNATLRKHSLTFIK